MNIVLLLLLLAGIAASLLSGRGDGVLAALQDGTANAVGTVLKTSGASTCSRRSAKARRGRSRF